MKKEEKKYFEYDWTYDGNPASYKVDANFLDCVSVRLDSGAIKSNSVTPLLKMTLAEKKHSMFCEKTVKKLFDYACDLALSCCACLVACVNRGLTITFFLYEGEPGSLESFISKFKVKKNLIMRYAMVDEVDYLTYKEDLYPNRAKMQTINNAESLQFLRERGDTLTPRRLNLHMAFPSEPACLLFAPKALDHGFAIGSHEDSGIPDLAFGLVIHRVCELNKASIDAVTTDVIELADTLDGSLVYWDCQVQSNLKK